MDKFDVMEVNEKQRKRIDHLLSVVDNQLRKITKQEKIIEELESEIRNLKEQIDDQTDWRNFVQ